jgi:ribosome-binding protein aMBF1 (putative translation factor)
LAAKLSQEQLAKKVGEKTSVIVDIENSTGEYVPSQINAIEKALNVKIPRGRKK